VEHLRRSDRTTSGLAIPDPDELLTDIIALENWRALVHRRSEDTAKKRKVGPPPIAA